MHVTGTDGRSDVLFQSAAMGPKAGDKGANHYDAMFQLGKSAYVACEVHRRPPPPPLEVLSVAKWRPRVRWAKCALQDLICSPGILRHVLDKHGSKSKNPTATEIRKGVLKPPQNFLDPVDH